MDNANRLTVIITFLNEGIEIEKTVDSINKTSSLTDILLIDDASYDNYDYHVLCEKYSNVTYHRNDKRLGVAASRNLGVTLSPNEYFVLLDGHMRFYEHNWDIRVLNLLAQEKYKQSILCSNSVIIRKDDQGNYSNEDNSAPITYSCGATAQLNPQKERCFRHAWNYVPIPQNEDGLIPIPVVLGAFYASNRTHWAYIHGLNGLIVYGLDEALMSIKTFMVGGQCYLIENLYVGHVYREEIPYPVNSSDVGFNEWFCISLFVDNVHRQAYSDNLYRRLRDESREVLVTLIDKHLTTVAKEKMYLNKITIRPFREFLEYNNQYIK